MNRNSIAIIIIFIMICSGKLSAQTAPDKYWLQFTDKNNNGFSLNQPEQYLSTRSIERRIRQNIDIDEKDMPLTQSYIDSLNNLGLTILNKSKWFNAITVSTQDTLLIDTITSISFIASKEKAIRIRNTDKDWKTTFESIPSNKSIKDINSNYNYGAGTHQIEMLNGHLLHNLGFKGEGMHIAVIDAGFLYADVHPAFDSLFAENRILGTKDFVDLDDDVFTHHQHGMNVLSTMAALQNGVMVGTAPRAKYLLLRSENTASEYRIEEDNWVSAAEYADSAGIDIINTSLGYNTFTDPLQDYTYADVDGNTSRMTIASDIAASRGMIAVISAGNSGNESWHYIDIPGDADSALTVGAVKTDSSYAFFSSVGPTYDGRIKPDISALGDNTSLASGSAEYGTADGTSFASPTIAGLAACLWQAHPDIDNMGIIEAIIQSSNQYFAPDSLMGYGIPNFYQAHFLLESISRDDIIGNGLLKVFPNPFYDRIYVDYFSSDSQKVCFDLYDLFGKLIFRKELNVLPNNYERIAIGQLNSLRQGVYVLRVSSKNAIHQYKLVKNGL